MAGGGGRRQLERTTLGPHFSCSTTFSSARHSLILVPVGTARMYASLLHPPPSSLPLNSYFLPPPPPSADAGHWGRDLPRHPFRLLRDRGNSQVGTNRRFSRGRRRRRGTVGDGIAVERGAITIVGRN